MTSDTLVPDERSASEHGPSVNRWAVIIGTGIFATTLAQPGTLDLPFRHLLKDDLQVTPSQMALFFGLGAFAWYFKPLFGLLSDSVPLFGTRRRHYLIFSALLAGLLWGMLAFVSRSYLTLLFVVALMQAMLVMASTVVGGMLVEAGQGLRAEGRLSSTRVFVENACIVIAGPLAGLLAGLPFGVVAAAGSAIALSVVPVAFFWLKEPTRAKIEVSVVADAFSDLKAVLRSPDVWKVAIFLVVVSAPQSFQTTLYYHQKNQLGVTDAVIGYFTMASGLGGVLAALVYHSLCRQMRMRPLLILGVVCPAIAIAIFTFYRSVEAAIVIEALRGFLFGMGVLALMQSAVLVTPGAAAALGFALLMSAWNGGVAIGDNIAAVLVERYSMNLFDVCKLYAVLAMLTLCLVPLLPRRILDHTEGGLKPK